MSRVCVYMYIWCILFVCCSCKSTRSVVIHVKSPRVLAFHSVLHISMTKDSAHATTKGAPCTPMTTNKANNDCAPSKEYLKGIKAELKEKVWICLTEI